MALLRNRPVFPLLRLLALGMLVFGLLANPVLAADCQLQEALFDSDSAQVDPGDGCCPDQACDECCTVATATPSFATMPQAITASSLTPAAGAFTFEPAPYPVSMRPPIAG